MRRELFSPFLQGARLGAWVTGVTLALSLFGATAVIAATVGGEDAIEPASVALEPTLEVRQILRGAPAAKVGAPLEDHEIDPGLLLAARHSRIKVINGMPFQLSREVEEPVAPPPPAEPAASVAQPAQTYSAPAPPPPAPVVVPEGDLLDAIEEHFPNQVETAYSIIMCESSGNTAAVSPGGLYHGMWQFDVATWQSVGGAGLPSQASLEEQMMRARMLYDARGWSPWGCAYH